MTLILPQNGIIVCMSQPLISVIIPVYNTNTSAVRLISALLKDKYQNLEIIVVDDGSTDNTPELLKKLKDPCLQIIRQKNAGASAARNRGIELSSGDYLIFIDSDDEISKDFISELVKTIQKPNTALAVTGYTYRRIRENKTSPVATKPIRRRRKHESLQNYTLFSLCVDSRLYSSVNKIYHANIIRNNNIYFDEKLNFAEDTKFVLDYLSYASGDIKYILKPAYIYNYGTETSTVKKSSLKWSNWQKSYQNLKAWVGKNPSLSEKFWLKMILLRWRISHHRAIKCFK